MFARRILLGVAMATLATAGVADSRHHDTELTARKIGKVLIQTGNGPDGFVGQTDRQITASSGIDIGNKTGFFVVTFTASSICYDEDRFDYCTVQILCDRVEALPASIVFDSTPPRDFGGYVSVTGRSNPVTGGTHSCEARTHQSGDATALSLSGWTFMVQFWQQ